MGRPRGFVALYRQFSPPRGPLSLRPWPL